jgi:Na+/phosphate symporter
VIGGWFLTAIIAFTVALIVANIIYWGGVIAMLIVLAGAGFFIYRTHKIYKSRESEKEEDEKENEIIEEITNASSIFEKCQGNTLKALDRVPDFYDNLINGLATENRQILKDLDKSVRKYNKKTKKVKNHLDETVRNLQVDLIDTGHYYVQSVDYLREIAHCLNFMAKPALDHVSNNHNPLNQNQVEDLTQLNTGISKMYRNIVSHIENKNYHHLDDVLLQQQELLEMIKQMRIKQVKRLRDSDAHTRPSLLFLDILAETKNLLLYSINLLKSQRDFIIEISK